MTEYITFDTDDVNMKEGNLTTVRNSIDNSLSGEEAMVSVCVRIWRDSRLEKLKRCIDSVLKYGQDVKFKLVLMNNGGSQAITDYFESIKYNDKMIIKITKNISAPHGGGILQRFVKTKYMVELFNDNIVTPNWLTNMLFCLESDPQIGIAFPMCTNTSCEQEPPFGDRTVEELIQLAKTYNCSDSSKWEERICCIPQGAVFRRAAFDLAGIYDKGYMHEYGDDDLSLRIRRAGYKLILCKDTVIIHDHDYSLEPATKYKVSQGEDGFKKKFYGLEPHLDFLNWVFPWIEKVEIKQQELYKILGIEVRAGTPILDIKNKAYMAGNKKFQCESFSTNAKYYEDLSSLCSRVCTDSDELRLSFLFKGNYDFIVIGKDINSFACPFDVLDFALNHVVDGYVLFSLKNMQDICALVHCLGGRNPAKIKGYQYITLEEVQDFLKVYPVKHIEIMREKARSFKEDVEYLCKQKVFKNLCQGDFESVKQQLSTFRYWILVQT